MNELTILAYNLRQICERLDYLSRPEAKATEKPFVTRTYNGRRTGVKFKKDLRPANAGRSWSKDEDAKLLSLVKENKSFKEITIYLGRSRASVQTRMTHLRKAG